MPQLDLLLRWTDCKACLDLATQSLRQLLDLAQQVALEITVYLQTEHGLIL